MAAKGSIAKDAVVEKIAEAFGEDFLGSYDKKYYVRAKENGQYVQIAISLTCPKTPVESFGSMDFGNNELNFEDGATIQPVKKATEITSQEEENLKILLEKLGL